MPLKPRVMFMGKVRTFELSCWKFLHLCMFRPYSQTL